MAMSVVYTTINGRMIQQVKGGQVTKFVSDTLGSVVAEVDDTGQITHTADYWPYGEVRTETGTKKSPFGFVGVLGYMKDFADALYVRARYLRARIARWQTIDQLWPNEQKYAYASLHPISSVDPTGLVVIPILCGAACITTLGCGAGIWIACGKLWGEPEFIDCVQDYINSLPVHSQIGCMVGLMGCLACLIRYGRRCINRRTGCKFAKVMKEACCHTPRACNKGMRCGELKRRLMIRKCCHDARLYVGRLCFGGIDDRHAPPLLDEATGIKNCLKWIATCRD